MSTQNPLQMNLFADVLHAYTAEREGRLDNATLYREVAQRTGIPLEAFEEKTPVGEKGQLHSLLARKIRWYQQTLKAAGILEGVPNERGWWQLTGKASKGLSEINRGVSLVGFSTNLGVAILGHCDHVFTAIDSPITLVVTSPPYPLAHQRSYGNVHLSEYIGWLCKTIAPVVKNLVPGGSICLNVSQDRFLAGSPARSTYLERLVISLEDELGLSLMDRLIWSNPSKAPGPVRYASIDRTQLNVGYEPVLWFTNDPFKVKSNNRRVLMEHTDRHLKLIQQGGEQRQVSNSDGAYTLRQGSFGKPTEGKIPRNVLTFGHACKDQQAYKKAAREMGLKAHGAPMPLSLAKFLIEFLSDEGEMVVDIFGGSFTTAKAAEILGRRWLSTECMAEYVIGGSTRFTHCDGFTRHLLVA